MLAMGVLYDYFAAGSDEEAGTVIDRVGGPGSQPASVPPAAVAKRGLFGRKRARPGSSSAPNGELPVYDTVSLKGIDPFIQLATLEELLTGRPYADVVADPRSGHVVESRDDGERLISTITDSLTEALIEAKDEDFMQVAEPWSQAEEFWGQADPQALVEVLRDLASLAQRAQTNGQRMYCWVCV
jgi:hypothetical protein